MGDTGNRLLKILDNYH